MITPKKITRRDAIKILGAAAGASVLANLPSKWSTPELTSGVLPAHAQASITLECGPAKSNIPALFVNTVTFGPGISVTPAVAGINILYNFALSAGTTTCPLSGTITTDITGDAPGPTGTFNMSIGDTLTATFTLGAQICVTVYTLVAPKINSNVKEAW